MHRVLDIGGDFGLPSGQVYAIAYHETALKAMMRLERSDPNAAKRIRDKLAHLAKARYAPNNNVKALQGRSGYRLRVGDYRVIYELQDDRLIVLVMNVGPRGSIYE